MARNYTLHVRAKWILQVKTPEGWRDAVYFGDTKAAFGIQKHSQCPLPTRVAPATVR
jgi:hypothetical protein